VWGGAGEFEREWGGDVLESVAAASALSRGEGRMNTESTECARRDTEGYWGQRVRRWVKNSGKEMAAASAPWISVSEVARRAATEKAMAMR
jgi:hypothetical protein